MEEGKRVERWGRDGRREENREVGGKMLYLASKPL